MKQTLLAASIAVLVVACGDEGDQLVGPPVRFVQTFEDGFDGAEGALPDLTKWAFDTGTGPDGDGWGNAELQFYTGRPDNVSLDGAGNLRIVARREPLGGRQFTSARIRTEGNFEQAYGRFEARIQVPAGQGIWSAFWMLGADFSQVGWPDSGEIDVMELRGQVPDRVVGSAHGPGFFGGEALSDNFLNEERGFDEDFHVFAVEWDPGRIAWFVDDVPYFAVTTAQVRTLTPLPGATRGEWVFDHPFFMILNVAVGGTFVGDPDPTTPFPSTMLVDYVRVYERAQ